MERLGYIRHVVFCWYDRNFCGWIGYIYMGASPTARHFCTRVDCYYDIFNCYWKLIMSDTELSGWLSQVDIELRLLTGGRINGRHQLITEDWDFDWWINVTPKYVAYRLLVDTTEELSEIIRGLLLEFAEEL